VEPTLVESATALLGPTTLPDRQAGFPGRLPRQVCVTAQKARGNLGREVGFGQKRVDQTPVDLVIAAVPAARRRRFNCKYLQKLGNLSRFCGQNLMIS
jgi:hypothetical protein